MMVVIKCQHSGLEFEAKTKRTKQHPLVAEFKNEANKADNYRQAVEALEKATTTGGYDTIEQYLELVQDIMDGKVSEKRKNEQIRLEYEEKNKKRRIEAKKQREATNNHLKENGYIWSQEIISDGFVGQDEFWELKPTWVLRSPDGRVVTVNQALDEIERGTDVVQEELSQKIEKDEKIQQEWENEKEKIKNNMVQVKRFYYDNFNISFSRNSRKIYKGKINGIDCAVIYNYRSYYGNDYDVIKQFYCSDPGQANLETVSPSILSDFFGE